MNDEIIVRELLAKEEDAVFSYLKAASEVTDLSVRKILISIAFEEKVHKGELIQLLKNLGVWDSVEIFKGESEVNDKLEKEKN